MILTTISAAVLVLLAISYAGRIRTNSILRRSIAAGWGKTRTDGCSAEDLKSIACVSPKLRNYRK
jgi:hypothetical protein